MFYRFVNYIVDKLTKETSASNLSSNKELVIGNVSAKDIRENINEYHATHFNSAYASLKFQRSIQAYKEALRK